MKLSPLTFGPITHEMLADYADVSHDRNPIHLDAAAARRAGFDDVIAHGLFPMSLMARAVTQWSGPNSLVSLSARFTAPTPIGALITVSGKVKSRGQHDGGELVVLDLTARTDLGTEVIVGVAQVLLD